MKPAEAQQVSPTAPWTSDNADPKPWGLAWCLAVGQLLSWGVLYYTFTVMLESIATETTWSRSFLNAGLSLGLLVWGLSALPVGAWIQNRGGRAVMAAGSLLGGLSLLMMSAVHSPLPYLISWVGLGIAMGCLLYDPAFAVITQTFRSHYRQGITLVTLLAGLASTAFIPLVYLAESHLGWRGALQACGALLIIVGAPLHWLSIPKRLAIPRAPRPAPVTEQLRQRWSTLRSEISDRRFLNLALWFTAYTGAFSGLTFLIIPLLTAMAVAPAMILKAIVIIGPMQVLGRLLLAAKGHHFSSLQIGRAAMTLLLLSLTILITLPPSLTVLCLFAALFGLGNGVMTIVKGTAPAELFGTHRYAELNGVLAMPSVFSKALSPWLLVALWGTGFDPKWVLACIAGLLALGALALELASRSTPPEGDTEPHQS